jgi:hypothetical protein
MHEDDRPPPPPPPPPPYTERVQVRLCMQLVNFGMLSACLDPPTRMSGLPGSCFELLCNVCAAHWLLHHVAGLSLLLRGARMAHTLSRSLSLHRKRRLAGLS